MPAATNSHSPLKRHRFKYGLNDAVSSNSPNFPAIIFTTKTPPLSSLQFFLSSESSLRTRGGAAPGPSRWASPGHEEHPKGYLFNRTPPPPGQSRKWEDWELPCYITSFLTIVILGVGLNAKPDLTIETWAHQKALERLELEKQSD